MPDDTNRSMRERTGRAAGFARGQDGEGSRMPRKRTRPDKSRPIKTGQRPDQAGRVNPRRGNAGRLLLPLGIREQGESHLKLRMSPVHGPYRERYRPHARITAHQLPKRAVNYIKPYDRCPSVINYTCAQLMGCQRACEQYAATSSAGRLLGN